MKGEVLYFHYFSNSRLIRRAVTDFWACSEWPAGV